MANILLLAGLLFLLSYCLAETVSIRALRERKLLSEHSVERSHFLPPVRSTIGDTDDELELLDICLVASVDGRIHGLDRSSGQVLWSLPSPTTTKDGSTIPPALQPLVRTQHVDFDPYHGDTDNEELYIIEPQSGNIYILPHADGQLQMLPFSMPQLVDMGAFSFNVDGVNRMFVGKKETSLLMIELETGRLRSVISSECPWDPFADDWDVRANEVDLDELEGSKPAKKATLTEVLIGRTGAALL